VVKLSSCKKSYKVAAVLKDQNFQKKFSKSDKVGSIDTDTLPRIKIPTESNYNLDELYVNIENMKKAEKDLNHDIMPLINVSILGKTYLAILDTGATFTCVGQSVYDDANRNAYQCLQDAGKKFTTAGGVMQSTAVLNIPIKIGDFSCVRMQKVFVIPTLPIILLGRDFIRKHNINFSLLPGDSFWTFKGRKHPFASYKTEFVAQACLLQENKVKMVNDIKIQHLNPSQQKQLKSVLMKNKDIFSDMPGQTSAFEFEINFKEGAEKEFVKSRPYTANPQKRAIIDQLMDEAIANDFIEPADSFNCPIAVPTVIAPKPNGKFRMCQDYKRTNKLTTRDSYCLPTLPSLFQKLEKAKFFTVFDITKGFHQIRVKHSDRWKTAFINHRGVWQYKVMPFGMKNSPAAYQRLMDQILGELRGEFCVCYMDDIIIHSETFSEHLEHINLVLECLKRAGLTVNPSKIQIALDTIKYLGMIFSPGLMQPNPEKVRAIKDYPIPKNQKDLQHFIGMLGFFRIYVFWASILLDDLHKLISKGSDWIWQEKHTIAFNAIKDAISDASKLQLPDMNRPFTIRTDACDIGISAILLQEDVDGKLKAISFASKTLNKAERNYSTSHKECLAVIYGVRKFRMYIENSPFVVETDHQALKWLMSQKEPTGRLARWALELQEFDMEIKYRKGSENQIADALSRAPVDPPDDEDAILTPMQLRKLKFQQIQDHLVYLTPDKLTDMGPYPDLEINALVKSQNADKLLKPLIAYIVNNHKMAKGIKCNEQARIKTWSEDCMIFDNGLLVKYVPGARPEFDSFESNFKIVVPGSLQVLICKLYHDHPLTGGHKGILETTRKIQEKYTWSKMGQFIRKYVQSCDVCQKANPTNQKKVGFLVPNRPLFPWEIIAVDFTGPLPRSSNGYEYILVFCDLLSKWVELFALRSASAEAVVEKLYEVCCRLGFPRKCICDNGTQFTGHLFEEVCRSFNIDIKYVPAYHAQANPAERMNRNIKFYLKKYAETHKDWDKHIHAMQYAIRSSLVATTKFTPAEMMLGRKLNDPFAPQLAALRSLTKNIDNAEYKQVFDKINNLYPSYIQQARDNLQSSRQAYRARYDHYRRAKVYKLGELVTYKHPFKSIKSDRVSAKLFMDREGPYRITSIDGHNIYRLSDVHTGALITKAHVSQLTPYVARDSHALPRLKPKRRLRISPGVARALRCRSTRSLRKCSKPLRFRSSLLV